MKRRTLLQLAGLGALTAGCGGGGSDTPPADPAANNILMIAIDDLNDWVGFLAGHPQVKTPGMDALAARSSVFRKAYCNAPVCSPSRASVLSGLSVQNTGVFDNNHSFKTVNPDKSFVDEMFGGAGYTVRRFGKIGHSVSPYTQPVPATVPFANQVCSAPAGSDAFDWGPAPGEDNAQPDHQFAQQGIDFLNAQAAGAPFFLSVGFIRTHVGWYVPQRYFDLYPLDTLTLPEAPVDDLGDLGPTGRAIALKSKFHDCIIGQGLWAEAVQGYLASISWVDSQIARLINALDASPHAKNTTVVLWSDHGFHLGEKFHWHKLALWERSTHVPFLIHQPGQTSGKQIDACVSLRDLAPTLLDLHGVAAAYPMDGRSLTPLLKNPAQAWNVPVLTTMNQHDHAIRTEAWRYIRYASGERELYDEVNDPAEHFNLANDNRFESVMTELDALMPAKV